MTHNNRPSVTKFNHGIASYPTEYRGHVVSPEKICIQFNKLQCKTRINQEFKDELAQRAGGYWEMPIAHLGSDIEFLAVGMPIKLHKVVQIELLDAYKEHILKYGNEMKEFLKFYHTALGEMLRSLDD